MAQRIPKEFIDLLLEKSNIVDVINQFIKIDKKGNDYWACCPFHTEKTSSFSVSEKKQFYYCFGCGAKGSAINFIMDFNNVSYPEAIEILAKQMGMEVPRDKSDNKEFIEIKKLQNVLEEASKIFIKQLKDSDEVINYLKKRGLSGETAKIFNIGYSENEFDSLKKNLLPNFSEETVFDAGLIAKSDKKQTYDKFRGRVMFPIHNTSGNIVGFGGRLINDEDKGPKYMNSPETKLYSKKKVLYGMHLARKNNETNKLLYVVEGYMDAITLYQAGIENVVATSGTSITQEHLTQCFRHTNEIVFCFDGDLAGAKAAWRGVENVMPIIRDGNAVSFIFLDEGQDPDSLIKSDGAKKWESISKKRVRIEEFIYKKLVEELDINSSAGKAQYIKEINELLKDMKAEILKGIMLKDLAKRVGVEFKEEIKEFNPEKQKKSLKSNPVRSAIVILMNYPNIIVNETIIKEKLFLEIPGMELLTKIIYFIKDNDNVTLAKILEHFRDSDHFDHLSKLCEIEMPKLTDPQEEFNGYINMIYKNQLEITRNNLLEHYKNSEEQDDSIILEIAKIDKLLRNHKFL
ncbi:MAG: DNA primase [Gammaproteobacteria bacterium]|nr:DNA primase [Gammaproteobacteria bacterium]|tara:strand:+ start:8558 stop:10279 length:1722 start_codon:yes stop_codon:yes gene_type:complete